MLAALCWPRCGSRSTRNTVNKPPALGRLRLRLMASACCTNSGDACFIPSDPLPAQRINDFASLPHTAAPVECMAPLSERPCCKVNTACRHLLRSNLLLPKCTYKLWADLHGRSTSKTRLLLAGAFFRATFRVLRSTSVSLPKTAAPRPPRALIGRLGPTAGWCCTPVPPPHR